MPYGLVTLLASAGCLETAYLTLVDILYTSLVSSAWLHVLKPSGLRQTLMACACMTEHTGQQQHSSVHPPTSAICMCPAQSKLLNAPVTCPTSGSCDTVLNSGYASVFGLPLPLLGALLDVCFSNFHCTGKTRYSLTAPHMRYENPFDTLASMFLCVLTMHAFAQPIRLRSLCRRGLPGGPSGARKCHARETGDADPESDPLRHPGRSAAPRCLRIMCLTLPFRTLVSGGVGNKRCGDCTGRDPHLRPLLCGTQGAQCWPARAGICCTCWPRSSLASPAPGVSHLPRCQLASLSLLRVASRRSESPALPATLQVQLNLQA